VDALTLAMSKKVEITHWGSKGNVNRAGQALRANTLTAGQAAVLETRRMAHRAVIHTFEALLRARAKNKDVQVAQRLKRRRTIIDKLSRFPRMELARMDDVAGCRLIFPTIEALHEFREKVHRAKFKHILKTEKNKYDYIESPTPRGYRGIHDIYEYRARKGRCQSSTPSDKPWLRERPCPKVLICRTGEPSSKTPVFLGFALFGFVFHSNFTLVILKVFKRTDVHL